jgi:hypothetical protein
MSKTLKIKRGEAERYEDLFRQVGAVGRGDTEDRDTFLKFKYAVGKNWKKLESLVKEVHAKLAVIMEPDEHYRAFQIKREEIADKYATKDAEGNVIFTPDKDDPNKQQRTFTQENQLLGEQELDALKAEYESSIKKYEEQAKQAQAYLDEEIMIELYSVPFDWVAERIAGAWLDAIEIMLTDLPDTD